MEKYRVSKYIDEIRKVKIENEGFDTYVVNHAFYHYFENYKEAKEFVVNRHKMKIINLERELKLFHRKTSKLENLIENK